MIISYLVFWYDGNHNVGVFPLNTPPHDPPRGGVLHKMLEAEINDGLEQSTMPCRINGIVELRAAAWAAGTSYELNVGDGRVGALECTADGWRVVL